MGGNSSPSMTPKKAERIRLRKRWEARLHAFLAAFMRAKIIFDPQLQTEAQIYENSSPRRPAILVAHHTRGIYSLLKGLDLWPSGLIVFANAASLRFLNVLKVLGIIPERIEISPTITAAHLRTIARGEAILIALADVNIANAALFHHSVAGRLRTFNAGWAQLAHRLGARVICLRVQLQGLDSMITHQEIPLQQTPYETAANALDWFFDTPDRIAEWDFFAAGALEPAVAPASTPDEVAVLYQRYGSSAIHVIGPPQGCPIRPHTSTDHLDAARQSAKH